MTVLWLGETGCHDRAQVGGKAAYLSHLATEYPVPEGFCVPAAGVAGAARDDVQVMLGYRALAARVGEAAPAVAVRSSAVDEDGAHASFAGQHETYLNVVGAAAVTAAVRRCRESAVAPRALAYRRAQGLAAGDVATPEKRHADNAAVSAQAAGVDCSGFVAKCLKIPAPCDSSQLPLVCDILPDAADLRPGDVLNIPRRHAMLVAGWAKPDKSWLLYYENGGVPEWKPALKQAPLAALLKLGYQPLRYRGMARETVPSGKEILTRAMRVKSIVVENPVVGDP